MKISLTDIQSTLLSMMLSGHGIDKSRAIQHLGISRYQFVNAIRGLREAGFNVVYARSDNKYYVSSLMTETEQAVISEIEDLNLNKHEIKKVISNLSRVNPLKYIPVEVKMPEYETKFGVFSDCHIGHSCYRRDVLHHAIESWRRQDIDTVFNCGDTIEGMSNRQGHIYELDYIGWSSQMRAFEEEFQPFVDYGIDVFSIEAETSHSGWSKVKSNQGIETGEELDRRSKAYKFIGYNEQDYKMVFDNLPVSIRLKHPGGGTAYAFSYKMQKYVNSISAGNEPDAVFEGHFHKINYCFLRNIHALDVGCVQEQTPYMKRKGTPAHLGYITVNMEVEINESVTIRRFQPEYTTFY